MADQAELLLIKKEVLEEVLERAYEEAHPNFHLLIESYAENKGDEKIEDLIFALYEFILSQPQPFIWLEEKISYYKIVGDKIFESPWMKTIEKSLMRDLEGAEILLEDALKLAQDPMGPTAYIEALLADKEILEETREMSQLFFAGKNPSLPKKVNYARFKPIRKDDLLDEKLQEKVKDYRDDFKKIINGLFTDEIFNRDLESYIEDINSLHASLSSLYDLLLDFHNSFKKKKLEKALVDFNDLEHYSLEVLQDQLSAQALQEEFDYIFVDEYQDSNPVQESIINSIRRKDNLFLVGDLKQSIYKFRLADPELFIDKYKTYKKKPKDSQALNERVDLSKNFRTREEILQAINYLFSEIMREETAGIDYSQDVWLWPGADYAPREDAQVELNIINKAETLSKDEIDRELLELSDAETEAYFIADKIKNLHSSILYDAKKKEFYPARWKDMTILFRSIRNWSLVFNDIFIKEGIPVYADDNQGYFDSLEIKIFLSLLKVIDNRKDDLSLLTLMRSPIGKFKTEELIQIRKDAPDLPYHEAAEDYFLVNDGPLADKLRDFYQKIDDWVQRAKYESTEAFLWSLMIETGFYYYTGAMVRGKERQANLKLLLERASALEKRGQAGLFNFIRFSDDFQEARGDMGTAKTIGENEDVVRMMTIHKSKGLEFPLVILAAAGRTFNKSDLRGDFLLHKDLGLGPIYVNPEERLKRDSLPRMAIKKAILLENMAEEMRVLYVALTRAKDKLIVVATCKDLEKSKEKWQRRASNYEILKADSYLDWMGLSLYSLKGWQEDSQWLVKEISKEEIQRGAIEERISKEDIRRRLEDFSSYLDQYEDEKLNERFAWSYPRPKLSKIPSKITVSDFNKIEDESMEGILYQAPSLVRTPSFLQAEKVFTPAEKGTIYHFFMQNCNLSSVLSLNGIEKEIERMIDKELLTESEADLLEAEKFLAFFTSSLGQRMLKSKMVKREASFVYRSYQDHEIFIQGIIDSYFEEDGQLVMLDYKTDFVTGASEERLLKRYDKQMNLYKEALEKISGKKVKESYIYSFAINKAILKK